MDTKLALLFFATFVMVQKGALCGLCNECFFNGNYTDGQTVDINSPKMEEFRRRIARLGLGFKDYLKNQKACLDAENHNDGEVAGLGEATGQSCVVLNFEYGRKQVIFRRAYYNNIQSCINNVKEKITEYEKNVACCRTGLEWNLKECRDGKIIRDGKVLTVAANTTTFPTSTATQSIGYQYPPPTASPDEVQQKNFSFVPQQWRATLKLTVKYDIRMMSFQHCCRSYVYWPRKDYIDARNGSSFNPVDFRNPPMMINVTYPNDGIYQLRFTLLMVDTDVPNPRAGNRSHPLLHWLVMNWVLGVSSDTVMNYTGPLPPDKKPHHYVFLLYEQPSRRGSTNSSHIPINQVRAQNFLSGGSRYLFDVNRFVRTFNLTLRAINWFQAVNDPYTNYTNLMKNRTTYNERKYCSGQRGWEDGRCVPITVGAATLTQQTFLFILPVVVIKTFF